MAIALNRTCGLEPMIGKALALRVRLSPVGVRGRYRCVERNVVVPTGYSKRFFAAQTGFYGGIFRAATALGMPARSALGGLSTDNAAAFIKVSIYPA